MGLPDVAKVENACKTAGLPHESFLYSTTCEKHEDQCEFDYFLPYVGGSTAGLLLILARWSSLKYGSGGLRKHKKESAATLLTAMLKPLLAAKAKDLQIVFRSGASVWPPLCVPRGDARLRLEGGQLDVAPLIKLASSGGPIPTEVRNDLNALKKHFGDDAGFVRVDAVFQCLLQAGVMGGTILGQLLLYTGNAVEAALFHTAEGKLRSDSSWYDASYDDVAEVLDNENALSAWLLRYVLASVEASRPFRGVGIVSDVGHCGLKLDVGFCTFPDNKCAVAVPQAEFNCA